MLVSASSLEEGEEKIRKEILRLKKDRDIFNDVTEIFIDDIILIRKVPEKASVLRYTIFPDNDTSSEICINPFDETNDLEILRYNPDEYTDNKTEQEINYILDKGFNVEPLEPFLAF